MNLTFLMILCAMLMFTAAFALSRLAHRARKSKVNFANVGEGDYSHGRKSYLVDTGTAVLGTRYLLYKVGSDADHVTTCGAGDVPIGQSDDAGDSANSDVPIAINLLGAAHGTLRCVTDGTIANGNYIKTAANGQATVANNGDAGIFGKALFGTDTTSNAGDVITFVPVLSSKLAF